MFLIATWMFVNRNTVQLYLSCIKWHFICVTVLEHGALRCLQWHAIQPRMLRSLQHSSGQHCSAKKTQNNRVLSPSVIFSVQKTLVTAIYVTLPLESLCFNSQKLERFWKITVIVFFLNCPTLGLCYALKNNSRSLLKSLCPHRKTKNTHTVHNPSGLERRSLKYAFVFTAIPVKVAPKNVYQLQPPELLQIASKNCTGFRGGYLASQ